GRRGPLPARFGSPNLGTARRLAALDAMPRWVAPDSWRPGRAGGEWRPGWRGRRWTRTAAAPAQTPVPPRESDLTSYRRWGGGTGSAPGPRSRRPGGGRRARPRRWPLVRPRGRTATGS